MRCRADARALHPWERRELVLSSVVPDIEELIRATTDIGTRDAKEFGSSVRFVKVPRASSASGLR